MADETCVTVKVQREKSDVNPTGVVVINKSDFIEGIDKLFVEGDIGQVEEAAPVAPWNAKIELTN